MVLAALVKTPSCPWHVLPCLESDTWRETWVKWSPFVESMWGGGSGKRHRGNPKPKADGRVVGCDVLRWLRNGIQPLQNQ